VRNWRVLTAVAAVVLAIVAGVLAWQYLDQADERAKEDYDLVPVFVAADTIPQGTSASDAIANELITQQDFFASSVPANAVTDLEQLAGRVAAATLTAGTPIIDTLFLTPTELRGFSQTIEEGKQAISFAVDPTRGVGGFIVPNDTVNVLVTFEATPLGEQQQPDEEGQPAQQAVTEELTTTAYLLSGLKVLAVGQTTATSAPEPGTTEDQQSVSTGVITVEADSFEAQQIVHAATQGSLYLSLNPPEADPLDLVNDTVEIVEAVNWFLPQSLDCITAIRRGIEAGTEDTFPPECNRPE
jgi:pilus assembly protein CpaB